MNIITEFIFGFTKVFHASKRTRQDSRLFKLSFVPWAIFMLLFLGSMGASWPYFVSLHGTMISAMEFLGTLGAVLSGVAIVLAWMVYVVTVTYLIYSLGTILASPVHSIMAERTLFLMGFNDYPVGLKDRAKVILRMIWVSILKSIFFLIIGLILFGFSFFPVFAPICSFIACLIIAMDCCDFSFELFEMNLRQRLAFFLKHLVPYSGLASAVAITVVIPGLFFLLLPVFVVAATELTYELRLRT